jgi:hypothetical protein
MVEFTNVVYKVFTNKFNYDRLGDKSNLVDVSKSRGTPHTNLL